MRSGARIDARNPRLDQIRATDIAEQLAKLAMHRGATWGFYSLAQHATLVAEQVQYVEGPLAALYALLRNADEAVGLASSRLWTVLHAAFDLDWPVPVATDRALVHAELCVTMTELRHLCTGCDAEVAALERCGAQPIRGGLIRPLIWDKAMDRYIGALKLNAVAAQLRNMPAMEGLL